MSDKTQGPEENWQNQALERLVLASITEQRRNRRWSIFFKTLFFLYFVGAFFVMLPEGAFNQSPHRKSHTALIDIHGVIAQEERANADDIASSLNAAFKDKYTSGIILRINSPGGSPVQSAYVYDEIKRLRVLHKNIKVYAVCVDTCASGAYYIASAADAIYANPSSLVGSIGVLMDGFGFEQSLQKLGIERRLFTAGEHKGFLDPFSPIKPGEKQFVQNMLDNVHQQFIESVKKGRGNRLKNSPEIFSGLAWDGQQAKQMGLIDDFGSTGYVAREILKNDYIVDYTVKPNYFEQLANKIGATFAHQFASELGLSHAIRKIN
ncbi:MAG: hypothetical protein LEGION0398_MBIBDBAK_00385 [Legionellaceae bacterium]